jgi:hypothetical protein
MINVVQIIQRSLTFKVFKRCSCKVFFCCWWAWRASRFTTQKQCGRSVKHNRIRMNSFSKSPLYSTLFPYSCIFMYYIIYTISLILQSDEMKKMRIVTCKQASKQRPKMRMIMGGALLININLQDISYGPFCLKDKERARDC